MIKNYIVPVALITAFTGLGALLIKENTRKEVSFTKPVVNPLVHFTLPAHSASVPALMVRKKQNDSVSGPLKITSLNLDVKVAGNVATTIMDITFYNDLDRILDGEFCFPLGEDQAVSYFAMESEKGLLEASVVEKEKGRIVYESIVRRNVDPALLEQTAGNNFRSRIYPIPAKGYKRILIGFEQKLLFSENSYLYYQPFFFKDKIENFKVSAEVFKNDVKPELYGKKNVTIQFSKWKENWKAKQEFKNYTPDKPLSFLVPANEKMNPVLVEMNKDGKSSFYFNVHPKQITATKKMPAKIVILWDRSGSSALSEQKSVMECLDAYMKKANYPPVKLVAFSNEITDVNHYSGNVNEWNNLKNYVKNLPADGGTQLGCLDLSKFEGDEFILVSDGMSNFGAHKLKVTDKPLYTICSSPGVNYSYLKYLSSTTGGSFINLNTSSLEGALRVLSSLQYRFISADYDKSILKDVFPSQSMAVNENFAMAGTIEGDSSKIILNFGIGNTVLHKKEIMVRNKPQDYDNMVPKMWAQTKLAELDILYEENKTEITELAKKYEIVTKNTSLLILDNLEDYLTHKVVPKNYKLRKQYLAQVNNNKADERKKIFEHNVSVVNQFEELVKWYETNYVYAHPKPIQSSPAVIDTARVRVTSGQNVNAPAHVSFDSVVVVSTGAASYAWNASSINGNVSNLTPNVNASYAVSGNYNVTLQDANGCVGFSSSITSSSPENKQSEITLGAWSPDAAYMKELKKTSKKDRYAKYLELKEKYKSTPSFFIDVSDLFVKDGENKLALRILSNVTELELENHQLMRVLAHRLLHLNETALAIEVFKDVLKIRAEEPQSYRDLGLAYEQNKQYQEAIDMLSEVVNKNWDGRFPGVETLVLAEINHIVSTSGQKLNLEALDSRLIHAMPVDMRVVMNWDTDNCDIDLWVTDENNEKCFYGYNLTQSGGRISNDFTGGYGPEVFMQKKTNNGNYTIDANYYGSRSQSLTGPVTVQAEIYTNYGRKNEKKKVITLRLKDNSEVVNMGQIAF
ncbi:MAG: hypothetical protein K0S32_26 [Bacteroidetes bacterium]|nr:hypothetical protein [Bacteroidota bacterium]